MTPPVIIVHTRANAAASRSRLRIMPGAICHFVRFSVLWWSSAQSTPQDSMSHMMAWMVPLWRLGSSPIAETTCEQV